MKNSIKRFWTALFVVLQLSIFAAAQTNEFTYQGKLTDAVTPSATYDFEFRLCSSETADCATVPVLLETKQRFGVAVSSGIFAVKLDFAAAYFTGADRFLEIRVRRNSSEMWTTLSPRQKITSSPYSIKSVTAAAADSLSAACVLCVTDAQIQFLAGNKLTGVITGNGAGLTNLNGTSISAGSITSVQLSSEALPNSANLKLLGSLRWDLLKGQSSFPVGGGPSAIAFDGVNMWVVSLFGDNVTKIRASDGANLGTFAVGNNPSGISFDGLNMWITNISDGNVTKLRASDGANLGSFSTGPDPGAIAFDGTNMWITRSGNLVAKLRASDGANLGTFAVGTNPTGIAFDGANIWVANISSNNVTKLRASDGSNLGTFSVGNGPIGIAFDGNNMWITSIFGNVTKLRASDGFNFGSFAAGLNQSAIAFDSENIWVTSQSTGTVVKLRASDGANLGSFLVTGNPRAIAFDGANMWVANDGSNTATRLPPAFPK